VGVVRHEHLALAAHAGQRKGAVTLRIKSQAVSCVENANDLAVQVAQKVLPGAVGGCEALLVGLRKKGGDGVGTLAQALLVLPPRVVPRQVLNRP
jgi:hypothetical protein